MWMCLLQHYMSTWRVQKFLYICTQTSQMVIITGGQAAILIWKWAKISYVLSHPSWPPHPAAGQPLRPVSPLGEGGRRTATPHPMQQHASLVTGTCSPPKQDRHASNHHHFKGERAYLALQSLIQKEKNNQVSFETCLLLELRQTRVDLTLKTSILTCTMYTAVTPNLPLTSAKAAL